MVSFSPKRIISLLIGLLLLLTVFLAMKYGLFLLSPGDKNDIDRIIIIEEGLSLNRVAEKLRQHRIITNKFLFITWARAMGYSREIRAGEFRLSARMAPVQIMNILIRGAVITYPVTVPEGHRREQIAELLEQKGLANRYEFLTLTGDASLIKSYQLSGTSLEGYLFPDTYHFSRGLSAAAIIDSMVRRFFKVLEAYQDQVESSKLSLGELITLASIVEKETGLEEERPLIASVFLNRLERGMRLESDPTVIYGIENFDGNITRKDLTQKTPYNTYVIRGLPPGPIASPGEAAIRAVLNPAQTDYLFFVSKNDGSHHFSKTFSEHDRAVDIYQRKKRRYK